jgi:hypothetical protein
MPLMTTAHPKRSHIASPQSPEQELTKIGQTYGNFVLISLFATTSGLKARLLQKLRKELFMVNPAEAELVADLGNLPAGELHFDEL